MPILVGDSPAVVSVRIVADNGSDPLVLCYVHHKGIVPTAVTEELQEIGLYDNAYDYA
ncbi:hypothetical protein [Haloquadratum walsbyi]|uniref:hypothetical protein n=1 Tax=Haloquadratum walsbyi TaxID=293091 RepID=UPI000A5C5B9F|nr:hypothetical protein [Haloquadratum walsbyi]